MTSFFDSCSNNKNDNNPMDSTPRGAHLLDKPNNSLEVEVEKPSPPSVSVTPIPPPLPTINNNDRIGVDKITDASNTSVFVTFRNFANSSMHEVEFLKDGTLTKIAYLEDGVEILGSLKGDIFNYPITYSVHIFIGENKTGIYLTKHPSKHKKQSIQFVKSNSGKFSGWSIK
jgi:hypothetical protein